MGTTKPSLTLRRRRLQAFSRSQTQAASPKGRRMSGSTEQLGKKISGARDLGGVVRAMKALAASSVGQYERAVEALDDYLRTVELGLIACLHGDGQSLGPGSQASGTHHRSVP
jgi:hypothetical protein